MLIWQASYFSIMKHTGKIREFIWKQHPFGIMIVYTIGVKAFVSLHYGHFRWSILKTHKFLYKYILQGNSSGQEIRVHFFTNVQIQICNPKTDIFRSFTKIQNALLIQMIHNWGGFFGSYLKPHTLDTWSEGFLYYGFKKSEYSHRKLEIILIHTAAVWQHCNLIWTRGMH